MRYRICILLLFITISAFSQDLSGKWTGIIDQPGAGFKLDLELVSKDGVISGTSKMTDPDGNYVIEKFSGKVVSNAVQIDETDVMDSTWPVNKPYFFWCVKQLSGKFIIEPPGTKISITGTWTSNKGYPRQTGVETKYYSQGFCSSGNFYISKPYTPPRPADLNSASTKANVASVQNLPSAAPVNKSITSQLEVAPQVKETVVEKPPVPAVNTNINTVAVTSPAFIPRKKVIASIIDDPAPKKVVVAEEPVPKKVAVTENPVPKKMVVVDGYYHKTVIEKRPPALASLREADVVYAKRVWRDIDVREKFNNYLASPKARLIDVLVDAVAAGQISAYDPNPAKNDPNGDSFGNRLTPESAHLKLADSVLVDKFDKDGNKVSSRLQAGDFNPDSILRFRIKEDWLFDKQRSVFEPRIIGIAPLRKVKLAGIETDYQPIFWIYFPEARAALAGHQVTNNRNDAAGLTFDDVFLKRLFTSFIIKVSNPADERIKDYKQGIDQLYESEKFKKALRDWELNLWQY